MPLDIAHKTKVYLQQWYKPTWRIRSKATGRIRQLALDAFSQPLGAFGQTPTETEAT